MPMTSLVLIFLLMSLSQVSLAEVIYGDDHRKEVSQGTAMQIGIAKSVATMIPIKNISEDPEKPGYVELNQTSLRSKMESPRMDDKISKILSKEVKDLARRGISFCEGERFVDQPSPSMCTGFLIAHDLLVTAGHCVELPNFCSDYQWVFGFEFDPKTNSAGKNIKENDVYKCKKVVSNFLNMDILLDYAIVQLDRSVKDRSPLEIRTSEKIQDESSIFVIGSPSGLPLKIADSANVRSNSHPFYFNANLDTFQGNSGSGVFDATTGTVEGILVRGEEDFEFNREKFCIEAKKCENNKCRGEDVTRILSVPEIGIQRALNRASESGNMVNLEKLLALNVWVDFYTKDGQSALMKGVIAGKINSVKALIARGANVNLKDVDGNTAIHLLSTHLNAENEDILKLLIVSGAKLEEKNNLEETPLLRAAKTLNLSAVKILISNGANKNALDSNGESILFPFAKAKQIDAIKELTKLGVNTSVKNNKGITIKKFVAVSK